MLLSGLSFLFLFLKLIFLSFADTGRKKKKDKKKKPNRPPPPPYQNDMTAGGNQGSMGSLDDQREDEPDEISMPVAPQPMSKSPSTAKLKNQYNSEVSFLTYFAFDSEPYRKCNG
jgi:hypothetical protein